MTYDYRRPSRTCCYCAKCHADCAKLPIDEQIECHNKCVESSCKKCLGCPYCQGGYGHYEGHDRGYHDDNKGYGYEHEQEGYGYKGHDKGYGHDGYGEGYGHKDYDKKPEHKDYDRGYGYKDPDYKGYGYPEGCGYQGCGSKTHDKGYGYDRQGYGDRDPKGYGDYHGYDNKDHGPKGDDKGYGQYEGHHEDYRDDKHCEYAHDRKCYLGKWHDQLDWRCQCNTYKDENDVLVRSEVCYKLPKAGTTPEPKDAPKHEPKGEGQGHGDKPGNDHGYKPA
ncbi:MAG: hypothetical protein H6850_02825 [Alphaproteobacteria bacterium]|nr:MAG: hypothetical protein H6850_02825 [Alphaproteobacteria bacterium]